MRFPNSDERIAGVLASSRRPSRCSHVHVDAARRRAFSRSGEVVLGPEMPAFAIWLGVFYCSCIVPAQAFGPTHYDFLPNIVNENVSFTVGIRFTLRVYGQGLSFDDRARLVPDTVECGQSGSGTNSPKLLGPGEQAVVASGGTALAGAGQLGPLNQVDLELQWTNLLLLEAGRYRLCWCSGISASCSADADFSKTGGLRDAPGPAPGQVFTCMAGWACSISRPAGNELASSRLRVMTSCAAPVSISGGFLPGTEAFASATTGLLSDPAVSSEFGGLTMYWGANVLPNIVLGPGQRYELCWCPGSRLTCDEPDHFLVQIGYLNVPGPSGYVSVLCTTGAPCHFAVPIQTAVDIGNGDKIKALQHTCGTSNPLSGTDVPGWPNGGVASATTGGKDFEWDAWTSTATQASGIYRLCWCHRRNSGECKDNTQFRFDIGNITIAGPMALPDHPASPQTYTCVRGRSCTLALKGTSLAPDDRYVIKRSCSDPENSTGFEGAGFVSASVSPTHSSNSTSATIDWSVVNADSLEYHICWTPVWQQPARQTCLGLGWNAPLEGAASTCGYAQVFHTGSCSSDTFASAKAKCLGYGARLCLAHEILQGDADSVGGVATCASLGSTPIWTAQSCSDNSHVVVDPSAGLTGVTCETDTAIRAFACCGDAQDAYPYSEAAYFNDPGIYLQSAGTIGVEGPSLQDDYCLQNDHCLFKLEGVNFNAGLDWLAVVDASQPCGSSPILDTATYIERNPELGSGTSTELTYNLGLAYTSGVFRMCWCRQDTATGGYPCNEAAHFNIIIGDLRVLNVPAHSFYCIYGAVCEITVSGALAEDDSVLVAPAGFGCDHATAQATFLNLDVDNDGLVTRAELAAMVPEIVLNPADTPDVMSPSSKTFNFKQVTSHSTFVLCYCTGYAGHDCAVDASGHTNIKRYSISFGTLEIWGPFLNTTLPRQRAGVPFSVNLTGRGLGLANRVSLQWANGDVRCGTTYSYSNGAPSPRIGAPSSVSGAHDWEVWNDLIVMEAGDFYFCWCYGEADDPCEQQENFLNFKLQTGWLEVDGLNVTRPRDYGTQLIGNPLQLAFDGRNVLHTDRMLLYPSFATNHCGLPNNPMGPSLTPSIFDSNQGNPASGFRAVWQNIQVTPHGEFLACWCGRAQCTRPDHFNIEATRFMVAGPLFQQSITALSGKPFRLELQGDNLTQTDRISIVDSAVSCGTPNASNLTDVVVPTKVSGFTTGQSDNPAAAALGPPSMSNGSFQAWDAQVVRWPGTYKLCWAGNYSNSLRCTATDLSGRCTLYAPAHFPWHSGNLDVAYGEIMVLGRTQIGRCDDLEIIAVSPFPEFSNYTARFAEWSCFSIAASFCAALQSNISNASSGNRLALHIPGSAISSSVDTPDVPPKSNVLFTLTVTMIDAQNITRRGSLEVTILAGSPRVQGYPQVTEVALSDELRLTVYAEVPQTCSSNRDANVTTAWQMANASGQPVALPANATKSATRSGPWYMAFTPAEIPALAPGRYTVSATIRFAGAYTVQQVLFNVTVVEARLPLPVVTLPTFIDGTCPAIVDSSASSDPMAPAAQLSYAWSCITPAEESCLSTGNGTATQPLQSLGVSSAGSGPYRLNLQVSSGARRATLAINISRNATRPQIWPATVAPVPAVIGDGAAFNCIAAAAAEAGTACSPPLDAAWALVNGTTSALLTALSTQRLSASGDAVIVLKADVPASMLHVGGRYRCQLWSGSTVVALTDTVQVSRPPSQGKVSVGPHIGIALQTQFSLVTEGWSAEHLPLEYAFLAGTGPAPAIAGQAGLDAAWVLRGWALNSTLGCSIGVIGQNVTVVARARDVYGSAAQVSTEIEVIESGFVSTRPRALAWWPPNTVSITTAAAALVNHAESLNSTEVDQITGVVLGSWLNDVWHAASSSAVSDLSRDDVTSRIWVVDRVVYLAGRTAQEKLTARNSIIAARVLEHAALQFAELSARNGEETIDSVGAGVLLEVIGTLLQDANGTLAIFPLLRNAERHLGTAILARMERNHGAALLATDSARWEKEDGTNSSLQAILGSTMVGKVPRSALAAGSSFPEHGLYLQIPASVQQRRRLQRVSQADGCTDSFAELQVTHWRSSPQNQSVQTQLVTFGTYQGLRAASSAEDSRVPYYASVRMRGCADALRRGVETASTSSVASIPVVAIKFAPSDGTAERNFQREVLNPPWIETYQFNVTWGCAQWSGQQQAWSAIPDMKRSVTEAEIECQSLLDGEPVYGEEALYLVALPLVNASLLDRRPADNTVTHEDFALGAIGGMVVTVLAVQFFLLGICLAVRDKPADQWAAFAQEGNDCMGGRVRSCVLQPTLFFFDHLWRINPIKIATLPFGSRGEQDQAEAERSLQVMPRDVEGIYAALAPSNGEEPPLRQDVASVLQKALKAKEATLERIITVEEFGWSAACCRGHVMVEQRERHARDLLVNALRGYRRIAQMAEHVRLQEQGVDLEELPYDSEEDPQTWSDLRVAHNMQQRLLQLAVRGDVDMTFEEREHLRLCQHVLTQLMLRCGDAEQRPISEHQADVCFAPPGAVRIQFVASETDLGVEASKGSMLRESLMKVGIAPEKAMGVVPSEPSSGSKANAVSSDDDAAFGEAGDTVPGKQAFITGHTYYMWVNDGILFIHRAETIFQNTKRYPQPLDQALSRYESSWEYHLQFAVKEWALSESDDRSFCLALRRGMRLHWRCDTEVRAWIHMVEKQQRVPIPGNANQHNRLPDVLHFWHPVFENDQASSVQAPDANQEVGATEKVTEEEPRTATETKVDYLPGQYVVSGAVGTGSSANGIYELYDTMRGKPKYKQIGGTAIIFFADAAWRMNLDDDTTASYCMHADPEASLPPSGDAWTTEGCPNGNGEPPPTIRTYSEMTPEVPEFMISGAGGVGASINGLYRHGGFYNGKPKFYQVGGEGIIYYEDFWRINRHDATDGWLYAHQDVDAALPTCGMWTTDGYPVGDAEPPPSLSKAAQDSDFRVICAGGIARGVNGKYKIVDWFNGRHKYRQLGGNGIMYWEGCWKINDRNDTTTWYYSHPDSTSLKPPQGPWTTEGYHGNDTVPVPFIIESAQEAVIMVAGAGGIGATANGLYRIAGTFNDRPLYKHVTEDAILYYADTWKINLRPDPTGWIYSHEDRNCERPPVGPWTTEGYPRYDAEPPPFIAAFEEERAASGASCFLRRISDIPATACDVFLETKKGMAVLTSMWYSHAGRVMSFALQDTGEQQGVFDHGLSAVPESDADLPGGISSAAGSLPPGPTDTLGTSSSSASAGGSQPREIQAVGVYLSDITTIEYCMRETAGRRSNNAFCIVLCMRDRVKIRLCYSTCYERLVTVSSLLRLRSLVYPTLADVPVSAVENAFIEGIRSAALSSTSSGFDAIRSAAGMNTTGNFAYDVVPADNSLDAQEDRESVSGYQPVWRGLRGCLELVILSANGLGLTKADAQETCLSGMARMSLKASNTATKDGTVLKGRTGLPLPIVRAFMPIEPLPKPALCRKTPPLRERTANPIWNARYLCTIEYAEGDPKPSDIRLEVWDTAGTSEFMGELTVPFPLEPCQIQYQIDLKSNPHKMEDFTKIVNGNVSFQVRWIPETLNQKPSVPRVLPLAQWQSGVVCGILGITHIRGVNLRNADMLSSDPYCVVYVTSRPKQIESWTTSTKDNTLNPEWHESHDFQINWSKDEIGNAAMCKIEIWDKDKLSSDEFLGEASFALPHGESNEVLDLELVPNRNKGAATVRGRVQVQMFFRDQFRMVDTDGAELSLYEEAFCKYYGTRSVDEQLVRSIAPKLVYFHLGFSRLLRGQVRKAWRHATHGLKGFTGAARTQGYLAFSAYLWSTLALIAIISGFIRGEANTSFIWGMHILLGVCVGLFAPDPARLFASFLCHDPKEDMAPEVDLALPEPPDDDGGAEEPRGESDLQMRPGAPPIATIPVSVISWIIMLVHFGHTDRYEVLHLMLAWVCSILACFAYWLRRATAAASVLAISKLSTRYDHYLWRYPSTLESHDVQI